MTEPNYSVNWSAPVIGTDGPVAVGDALVYNAALGRYVVATAANRTTADSGAEALALRAFGGAQEGTVSYQAAGVVAREISGLAAVSAGSGNKLVRVSTAGRLERIDAYADGDDVVGYAKPNGRVALHIGLPWQLIASAAGLITGRKVVYGDGLLAGAAHATISSDGYTEHSADRAGGAATEGDVRFAKQATAYARNGTADGNLGIWQTSYFAATADSVAINQLLVGLAGSFAKSFSAASVHARYSSGLVANGGDINNSSGLVSVGPDQFASAVNQRFAYAYPNILLSYPGRLSPTMTDPFKGGRGYMCRGARVTAATGNPGSGEIWDYVDETTLHPMWRLPDGTLFDLAETGSSDEANALTITASPAGSLAVAGYGHIDSQSASATVTIGAFVAPAAGKAKRFTIHNNNGDSATLVLTHEDTGKTAADRIRLQSGTNLIISAGETYVVSYSPSRARYVVAKAVA